MRPVYLAWDKKGREVSGWHGTCQDPWSPFSRESVQRPLAPQNTKQIIRAENGVLFNSVKSVKTSLFTAPSGRLGEGGNGTGGRKPPQAQSHAAKPQGPCRK